MKSYKLFFLIIITISVGAYSVPFAQCFNPQIMRIDGETQSDFFGEVVVGGSDINGDGIPDIIVGAPQYSIQYESSRGAGKAYVFSGADLSLLFSVEPDNPANNLGIGRDVDTLGDINHDGYGDFIVGADSWIDSLGGWHPYGAAIVYSGIDYTPIHIIYGDSTFSELGKVVSCIGDITKDGVNDFLVGGHSMDISGIKIYNGATGDEIVAFLTNDDNIDAGQDACGVGDLNGDSYPDFVMGIPRYYGTYSKQGRINAYSGKTFELLWTVYGDTTDTMLGGVLKGAGDVNADGYKDVICGIGDMLGTTSVDGHGYALIISGIDGSIIRKTESPDPAEQVKFGNIVAGVGDLNHDGYDDYAISDHEYNFYGDTWIFSGYDGSLLSTIKSSGHSISTAGDINGDGTPDIVSGSYRVPLGGATIVGRVYIDLCVYPDSTCSGEPDSDSDGWNDFCDNCPYVSEWQQVDSDNNGIGDRCTDSVLVDVGVDVLAWHNYGTATFDSVTSSGAVTVEQVADAPSTDGLFVAIPQGLPLFYNITTTFNYEGNIQVCLKYDPIGLTDEEEASIKLYHYDVTTWNEVTTLIDTSRNNVCGVVSSLSPFGIGIEGVPTDVSDDVYNNMPTEFTLFQNYPNPFNPQTTISYTIPSRSHVSISIVNLLGETVRTLVNESVSAGVHSVTWNGQNYDGVEVASGIFFYKITTNDMTQTKKMLLLK